ncbi:MAG: tautomerase [Pelagibacterium sp. SCN 64-44]|mgnify:CR=1 FL=1|nr:MAG: tautomerase [Pelagibacterium sp. SCN 64-44]
MPLVRIDVVKGRSEEQVAAMLQALHDAMVQAFEVPERDRYQVLTEHEPTRLILKDTGLGFVRSDERVLVQVFTRPRSAEKKRMLYTLTSSLLEERLGIRPEDVMVVCVDNGDVDWSFAYGRPQFLTGEL